MRSQASVALVIVLFVGFWVLLVAIALRAGRKMRARQVALFRAMANRVGGAVTEGSWARRPELHFTYLDRLARLELYSTGG